MGNSTTTITYDQRKSSESITFTGSVPSGEQVPVGSKVTLHSGDVGIIVRVTEYQAGKITGVIDRFEHWDQPAWNGLKPGSKITFTESHVFYCDCTKLAA